MPNLTQKKSDAMTKLVQMIPLAMDVAQQVKELDAYFADNGFKTGGNNAIVDGDCIGENAHLSATIMNDALAGIASLVLSTTNATKMRLASRTPVAGGV